MDVDDEGNVYLILSTTANSPGTLPEEWFAHAFRKTPHPSKPGYSLGNVGLIKVSTDGAKVLWATWIGGTKGNVYKSAVRVGPDHCPVLLTGTMSDDMPTTPGAFSSKIIGKPNYPGDNCASWVGKFSADGSRLVFGTYIGEGSSPTHGVALDKDWNVFVTMPTPRWPVTPGAFQTKYGGDKVDFGIAKFSPKGQLLAATYLGGNGFEFDCAGPDRHGQGRQRDDRGLHEFNGLPGDTRGIPEQTGQGRGVHGRGHHSDQRPEQIGVLQLHGRDQRRQPAPLPVRAGRDAVSGGWDFQQGLPTKNPWQAEYKGMPLVGKMGLGNGNAILAKFRPEAAAKGH